MFGIKIFKHAVRMVLNNWKDAIRIGLLPMAICVILVVLMLNALGIPLAIGLVGPGPGAEPSPAVAFGMLVTGLIWMLCTIWVFVNWHRYVLLSEYPQGWMPQMNGTCVGAYLWKSIQMGLIGGVSLVPVVLITMGIPSVGSVMLLIWVGFGVYAFFRISPVLPAAAIGQPLSFSSAWNATRPGAGAIVLVIILLMVFDQVAALIGGAVLRNDVVLGAAVTAILWAVTSLISVSILTTIYGIYVQKRTLD